MHLRRIEIRDFRKIGHREIRDLDDGLNIVVGDNEAGKSTLLAALRAAFFERHRVGGAVAEAMQPYGSTVQPRVAVDFEIDGQAWSLSKAFCQRQEATLTGPGERLSGDAVEDRLAELFSFAPPGRGGSKPEEHQGTHGLLWVEQGMRPGLGVGAGRDTLATALEREVGQVTGGERGRTLLAAAAKRRETFWDKRDKPRGAVVALRKEVDDLRRERDGLLGRARQHDEKVARLAVLVDLLARHARDDRLNKAVTAVGTASRALLAAERHGTVLKEAAGRRAEAERNHRDASERQDRRRDLVARRETARAAVERSGAEAAEAAAVAERRDARAREAGRLAREARNARVAADDHLRAVEEALQRRTALAVLAEQQDKLAAADAQAELRRAALARAEARAIDKDAVTALDGLERAADRARAELEAASVQLLFSPEGARRVLVDGAVHPSAEPLRLGRDTDLTLEGFGRLAIRPGGGTAALAAKAEAAGQALRDAFQRLGVRTVGDARRLLLDRTEAQAEATSLAKTLAVLAPKGLDALRQALGTEMARLARPLGEASAALAEAADAAMLDDARRARAASAVAEAAAEEEARVAVAAASSSTTEAATFTERLAAARRLAEAAATDLTEARAKADDDLLDSRCTSAATALAAARAAEAAADRALQDADPETARLVLERTERTEREIRKDMGDLDREKRDIDVELRALGQSGIGERLAEIDGLLVAKDQQLAAREREAAASRLLHDTLVEAQRESKDRWLAPVRSRVGPYLRMIHPDGEILLNEATLEIEGLRRDGVVEQFGALSMGAREQVAVITRLALADVLRAAGHPAAVILDDALVNTDEVRLDRMHNVLTRAAKSLQILVLTCRERDFLGLGATHRM